MASGQHRHVNGHPVTGYQAEFGQVVGGLTDLSQQLGIGDGAGVARFALPVDGDPIAVAGLYMPVDAVVRDVELAAHKPLREGRVGPVENLPEGLVPVQAAGLLLPEPEPIFLGRLVEVGGRIRCRYEFRRRRIAVRLDAGFGHLIWPFCPRQVRSKSLVGGHGYREVIGVVVQKRARWCVDGETSARYPPMVRPTYSATEERARMRLRRLAIVLLVGIVAVLPAGCGDLVTPAPPGYFSMYITEPEHTLVPGNTTENQGGRILRSLFTALVEFNNETAAVEYTGWPNPSPVTTTSTGRSSSNPGGRSTTGNRSPPSPTSMPGTTPP